MLVRGWFASLIFSILPIFPILGSVAACSAPARPPATPGTAPDRCGSPAACEQRAADRLEAARNDPAALGPLLQRFPKGGDLHNHMAGAVYAESYLAWAREDGMRVDGTLKLVDPSACKPGACGDIPASPDDPQYDAIVRAWSMKDFHPVAGGESGHDHFFAAFSKFGLVSHEASREPAMLAETIRRAADDGAIYLETLVTVARPLINDIAKAAGPIDPKDLPGYERKLHADPRWAELIATSRAGFVDSERNARALLHCDGGAATPACNITVRYDAQVGRTSAPGQIYAELLAAFEVSATEPRIAAINLVSPEDNATALQDYDLQMTIIGALAAEFHGKSPARVTLHAGELTAALAAPPNLAFHVRNAVELAHAERIGHGVDVMAETNAPQLLGELRARGVTVEICLSSNAFILEVSGAAHPLSALLAAGVPVAIATDDAGVSRSSLTGELVRAVTVQGLRYPQLKAMARASLTAAFVPGASLWAAAPAPGAQPALADACAGGVTASPAPACAAFLAASERARLQWKLEQQLAAFEAE
jgi:adenosine deaminase